MHACRASDYNEPRALPERKKGIHHSKWDHSLIVLIRREKEKQKSPDLDRALELISKELYGEKTHYILELIQNAEDEEASGISFTILGDEIKVWNNGEAFTPEDVKSICSVRGGKRNKIGFFGIGFKSVFNITDRPQVISGRYNFVIEKFIYPVPCETGQPEDFDSKRGAWFFLPCDKNKHKPEDLEQSMRDIDEKVLLFLRNLKKITFIDVMTGNRWYLEQKELEGNIVSLFNSSTNATTLWKVFSKDLQVPETFRVAGELRQKPEVTCMQKTLRKNAVKALSFERELEPVTRQEFVYVSRVSFCHMHQFNASVGCYHEFVSRKQVFSESSTASNS